MDIISTINDIANSLSVAQITSCALLFVVTVVLVRSSIGVGLFSLIAWPGTVAHELSHAIVGFIVGAKPCNMRLIPKKMPNGQWMLGSVSFRNLRWWNAPWAAMAPMLLAPISIGLALFWVAPVWEAGDGFGAVWRLFISAVILHASWPSSVDFRIAMPGLILIAGALLVLA